eukprot:jgi/Chlat1/1418/Chrsp12S01980
MAAAAAVWVKCVNSGRRLPLALPATKLTSVNSAQALELCKAVAASAGYAPFSAVKLVHMGRLISPSSAGDAGANGTDIELREGDTILAFVPPSTPPPYVPKPIEVVPGEGDADSDADEHNRAEEPAGSTSGRTRIDYVTAFLRHRVHVPGKYIDLMLAIPARLLLALVLWCAGSVYASRWDFGPVYVLASIVAVIFYNLGHRKPGESSAYSVFNENFEELPGTLNANQMDQQVRQGRL